MRNYIDNVLVNRPMNKEEAESEGLNMFPNTTEEVDPNPPFPKELLDSTITSNGITRTLQEWIDIISSITVEAN